MIPVFLPLERFISKALELFVGPNPIWSPLLVWKCIHQKCGRLLQTMSINRPRPPVWLRFPLGEIIYENRNISRQFGPNFPFHLATLLARCGGPLFRPSQIHTIRDVLTTATATTMTPLVGFQDRKNRAPPLRCTNFHLSLVINSPGKWKQRKKKSTERTLQYPAKRNSTVLPDSHRSTHAVFILY